MSTHPGLPKWLKFANRLIITFNRLGLSFGTWYILSIPGRKTGKLRSTPVSVLHINGQRYVVTGFETNWVKNARKVGKGMLSRGRKNRWLWYSLFQMRLIYSRLNSPPTRAASSTTAQGGNFHMTSRPKAASANRKS